MVRPTSRVDALPGSTQLIIGDVCDRASVVRSIALSGAGVVFHLAGLVRAANAAAGGGAVASLPDLPLGGVPRPTARVQRSPIFTRTNLHEIASEKREVGYLG